MSRVSDADIEQAWREVNEASASPDALAKLMSTLDKEQPAIVEFISEGASHWESDAADLVFHATLVIWRAYHVAGIRVPSVEASSLVHQFRVNRQWALDQQGDGILLQKKLTDFSRFSESELMRYVTELVFEAHEDQLEIEPEEQLELLIVLKSIVEAWA